MNAALDHALTTFDRADRDARALDLLELPPLEFRAYNVRRDTMSNDWLVVARGGREVSRFGSPDGHELATRAAALLNRKAWGKA